MQEAEEQRGKTYTKTPVVEVPEKNEGSRKRTFEEIMAENFTNLLRDTGLWFLCVLL